MVITGRIYTTMKTDKHRLFVIDIMRIICAFLIYARHSITMFGCTWGARIDEVMLSLTSPVMTTFFILSGFSIHYQHCQEPLSAGWVDSFLKKRIITIMPSYLLVVLIWPVVYPDQFNDWALLLPVDLLCVQTTYRTLFGILHNGGTWFVSCILFAYLMYPVVKGVLNSTGRWMTIVLICILHFLLIYSNVLIPCFSLDSLYSNSIARTAEFALGVACADLLIKVPCVKVSKRNKESLDLMGGGNMHNRLSYADFFYLSMF